MDDHKTFKQKCDAEIVEQGRDDILKSLTRDWFCEATKYNYSYHFEWLGRPIIQFPQDIVGVQQLLWQVKPDLVIETGIARGGSLIFYASILELIAQCGGAIGSKVLGVDIDIRNHNREAILAHPMSKRIEMIQGSSIDELVVEQVRQKARKAEKVMVCLDSNHTHNHVLRELRNYAPMVSVDSYLVVFDTVVEDLPSNLVKDRAWSAGNNPKTAVFEYIKEIYGKNSAGIDGEPLNFVIDKKIEDQLLITVAPSGFLRRTR
jgi:cephalosporin hydroxylase